MISSTLIVTMAKHSPGSEEYEEIKGARGRHQIHAWNARRDTTRDETGCETVPKPFWFFSNASQCYQKSDYALLLDGLDIRSSYVVTSCWT